MAPGARVRGAGAATFAGVTAVKMGIL